MEPRIRGSDTTAMSTNFTVAGVPYLRTDTDGLVGELQVWTRSKAAWLNWKHDDQALLYDLS